VAATVSYFLIVLLGTTWLITSNDHITNITVNFRIIITVWFVLLSVSVSPAVTVRTL
jgi:hypothetical protein